MSRKISKVELEAFRAYEKKQNFDFAINDDDDANLIVIYAPNGSGKTSFFDAVEWAMSGEIQRISSNQRVKEIADYEKGHILKNKENDKPHATVEIKFSDKEYLIFNTKEVTGSRKTDYAAGKLVSATSGINMGKAKEFVGKNILTHDQIDRFLRFQSSKDRYEALRIFWDFNNDTQIYKELLSITKEIQNQKLELKRAQDQITLDLDKSKLNNETINRINNLIQEYNYFSNELKIQGVTNDNLEVVLHKYISEKTEKERELLIQKENLKEVNNLFKVYKEIFQKKIIEFNGINDIEIPLTVEKINKLNKLAEHEVRKDKLTKDLSELEKIINKIIFLKQNENAYLEKEKEKENLINIQNELIPKRKKDSEALLEMQHELLKRSNMLREDIKNEVEINQKINKLDSLLDYEKLSKEFVIIEEELKVTQRELEEQNALMIKDKIKSDKKLKIAVMEVQELINNNEIINEFSQVTKNHYEELIRYSEVLIGIERKINVKEKEIEAYKKIGDDIAQLRKIGVDLLSKSNSTSCPLCNQEYESLNALLNNIENVSSEFKKIDNYNQELMKLKENRMTIRDLVEVSYKKIKAELKKEISNNAEISNRMKMNKASLEEKYKKNLTDKEMKYKELENMEILISEFNLKDLKRDNILETVKNLKTILKKNDVENKNQIKKDKEVLKKLEGNIHDLIYKTNKMTEELKQNEININRLNNNHLYKTYSNIELEIKNTENGYTKKVISLILNEKLNEKNKVKARIDEINNEILSIKLKLGNEDRADILSKYERLKEEVSKLEFFIYSTKKEFIKNFKKEDVGEEDFIERLKQLNDETELLKKQNDLLSKVINILSGYVNNTFRTDKEKDLKIIKAEIRNLNKHLKSVTSLKEKSHEYIKNRIENVFNLNSVNNIFQMIDPHPELTEIYFKLDEALKDGGLGLNIMCKDSSDDSKREAPILYLSSAQVNILSLSIFLASAIENTNEFNTILMDDPVQHLDNLNLLSFIDLIRIVCFVLNKQVIISTHDQSFFNLCKRKIDANYFSAKYFDLSPNLKNIALKN